MTSDDDEVVQVEEAALAGLALDEDGEVAVQTLRRDLRALDELGLRPGLSLIRAYPRADRAALVSTDVCSWHVDRAPHALETWLCTYHGAPTLGLPNDQARAHVGDPDCRARLRAEFGGDEGEAFEDYLRERCYDLHVAPIAGARAWSSAWATCGGSRPRGPAVQCRRASTARPNDVPGQSRLLLIC